MKKKKIVLVKDEFDGESRLDFLDEYNKGDVVDRSPKCNLEDLADLCDHQAENANYHEFNGVHKELAKVMLKQIDRDQATAIMWAIAERGGLMGFE